MLTLPPGLTLPLLLKLAAEVLGMLVRSCAELHFQIRAHPLPVVAQITDGRGPMIRIGVAATEPGMWHGHLVAIAADRWLIDLSIGQADRPGLTVAPLFRSVTPRFLSGETDLSFEPQPGSGTVVSYSIRLSNRGYERLPTWTDRSLRTPIVERIVMAIERDLTAPGRTL